MDAKYIEKCDIFIYNYDQLSKKYRKYSDDILLLSSLIYTGYDIKVDLMDLEKCAEIIKNNEHNLSEFRGDFFLPIIIKMSISGEPEKYYLRVRMTYEMLNQNQWLGSNYKLIAAMSICDNVKEYNVAEAVEKTLLIYKNMKAKHPYITSDEDITFASLLAVTNIEVDKLVNEMEKCYNYLKERFKHKNAIQSLSHVLTLSTYDVTDKCSKVINIFNDLRQKGKNYGTYFELAALGVFSMIEKNEADVVEDICKVEEYLMKMKCFSSSKSATTKRLLYAALLVNDIYIPKHFNAEQVAISSTIATLLAEEMVLTAIAGGIINVTYKNVNK